MFDLNATDGSVRKKPYQSPIPTDSYTEKPVAGSALDGARMVQMHRRLLDLYTKELDRQYRNRMEMAEDEDFYDNIQWSEEDAATLRDRGQMPLVYNVTSAAIDWVLGTEKRSRTDYKVLPRRKEHAKQAQRKTELMKYLSDANRTPFQVSRAFEDAVKVGIGWIEDGVQSSVEDEPLYSRYENWRNVLWDSLGATEPDCNDGRFMFRSKWLDYDIGAAMFPRRRKMLQRACSEAQNFIGIDNFGDEAMDAQETETEGSTTTSKQDMVGGYVRHRFRAIEAWIRLPVQAEKMSGGTFAGEIYDETSRGHQAEIEEGDAETRQVPTMRMYVAIFTTVGMLYFGPSPYRHNRYPLTPVWGFRRGRDGLPYGLIRRIKDIQVDVNKRASKALHILSTSKVLAEDGFLPKGWSLEEWQEEAARPDALLVYAAGKKPEINAERDLAQWHLELMSRSIQMIQQTSGITDENMGRTTNARSGVAIQRRQEQGAMATAKLFDNLRFAAQVRGEKQLSNVEQFVSERKAFRITNMRGTPEYVEVNDGLPENDIARSKADYVLSEADWRASMRQAAVDSLLDAMAKFPPDVIMVVIDLIVESMDLPNQEEMVKRFRAVNGQRDPDAEEPTQEEIAAAQAKAEADQFAKRMSVAQLEKLLADTAEKLARAKQIEAQMTSAKVDAQQKSINAAKEVIAVPAVAHVADHILHESGFVSRTDLEDAAIGLGAPSAPPPPDAAAQPGITIQ